MIELVVTDRTGHQRREAFDKPEITLGRAERSDVFLDDATVSKFHARLVEKDAAIILVDLRSDGGVWVNHRRVRTPQVILPSDEIRIGSFLLRIVGARAPARPAEKGRVVCPRCGGPLSFKRLADYCKACDAIFS
ncbi:FHA domain-containing protein [Myxococcota bacterium]|nr:FHA domain-containing protein [Myxococcota bacterium]